MSNNTISDNQIYYDDVTTTWNNNPYAPINISRLIHDGVVIDSEIATLVYIEEIKEGAYMWWVSNEDIYRGITQHMTDEDIAKFKTTIELLGIYP